MALEVRFAYNTEFCGNARILHGNHEDFMVSASQSNWRRFVARWPCIFRRGSALDIGFAQNTEFCEITRKWHGLSWFHLHHPFWARMLWIDLMFSGAGRLWKSSVPRIRNSEETQGFNTELRAILHTSSSQCKKA